MPFGRWRRLNIRVHGLFLAVAVFALFLSAERDTDEALGLGLLSVVILFFSVLAHEMGHAMAAARLGGTSDRIVIGPLGGLSHVDGPREAHAELITSLAGPLVNLGILLGTFPVLIAAEIHVAPLLSPLSPGNLTDGAWWAVGLKLTFWLNWVILLVNLLPAFPFDGARMLRAMLWPALDARTASQVAIRTSKLTAVGLCFLAWMLRDPKPMDILPTWLPLLLIAGFVYYCAHIEHLLLDENEWDEELYSYDFSQGYTSLERTPNPNPRPPMSLRRWIEKRKEARRRKRQSQELAEERQVDEILIRLHESGMEGLTSKERAILNRVSARYRNRQSN